MDRNRQIGDGREKVSEYLASSYYDPSSSVRLVNVIVETVASAAGVAPTELNEPVYEVVDVDAIDRLFTDFGSQEARRGHVSFEYEGYWIRIRSDGFVGVH